MPYDDDDLSVDEELRLAQHVEKTQRLARKRRWETLDKWLTITKRRRARNDASFVSANADTMYMAGMIGTPILVALGAYAYCDAQSRIAHHEAEQIATRMMTLEATKAISTEQYKDQGRERRRAHGHDRTSDRDRDDHSRRNNGDKEQNTSAFAADYDYDD